MLGLRATQRGVARAETAATTAAVEGAVAPDRSPAATARHRRRSTIGIEQLRRGHDSGHGRGAERTMRAGTVAGTPTPGTASSSGESSGRQRRRLPVLPAIPVGTAEIDDESSTSSTALIGSLLVVSAV